MRALSTQAGPNLYALALGAKKLPSERVGSLVLRSAHIQEVQSQWSHHGPHAEGLLQWLSSTCAVLAMPRKGHQRCLHLQLSWRRPDPVASQCQNLSIRQPQSCSY